MALTHSKAMNKTTTSQGIQKSHKKSFVKTDAIYGTKWR